MNVDQAETRIKDLEVDRYRATLTGAMTTDSSCDVYGGAHLRSDILDEGLAHEHGCEGRIPCMRTDAYVLIVALAVCLLEEHWDRSSPGLAWPLLCITIALEYGALSTVNDLLQVDAVDINDGCVSTITILIIYQQLVEIVEVSRQTPVAINCGNLQQALFRLVLLRSFHHINDATQSIVEHMHT